MCGINIILLVAVDPQVWNALQAGTILGPFPKHLAPKVHTNRFGVILKNHQPNKWRLITDLSHPDINDAIDPDLCSLSYVTVDEVARTAMALGKGSMIAKIDIK